MSLPTPPPPSPRPRPILLVQSTLAALGVVTGSAGLTAHIPAAAAWWLVIAIAAVNVGLGFYLQSVTTPLSAPQDARGVPLVAHDVAQAAVVQAAATGVVSAEPPTTDLPAVRPTSWGDH